MRRALLVLACCSLWSSGCLCCGPRGGRDDAADCRGVRGCGHCRCVACRMNRFSIGPLGCSGRCAAHDCRTRAGDYVEDVDRAAVRQTARTMARRSLRKIVKPEGSALSVHFCGGFEQAYVDLAEGLPPMTPHRRGRRVLTAPFYLLTGDHISSREWQTGYDLGTEMAEQDGLVDPAAANFSTN